MPGMEAGSQGGFLEEVKPELNLKDRAVIGVRVVRARHQRV